MKKVLISFAIWFTCLASFHGQITPNKAVIAFSIAEKDLIPEGIAYDSKTRQFFLSSINKEKVVAISESGKVSDFAKSGQDSIFQSLGMKADVANRRLWVLSNKKTEKQSYSAIHVFDIDSKELLKKFIISDEETHLFNDLVLTEEGNAFITDTYTWQIYTVSSHLKGIELFIKSDSLLRWANGIAISPDNAFLYVATNRHISIVDLRTREIKPIRNPAVIENSGIDGLSLYKGYLIAVVNGGKEEKDMHIAQYRLSPDGLGIMEMSIIDKGNPLFNVPTTAVIVGDDLFCLANTSLRIFTRNRMNETERLQKPLILKYRLDNNIE